MTKVLFLALHGPAFSGKDTCAEILRHLRSKGTAVVESRFAEPIYQMIRTQVHDANSRMSKAAKEALRPALGGLSIRQMAVAIGEGARQYEQDCWINIWRNESLNRVGDSLLVHGAGKVLVLVPDLRKEGERQAFHRLPAELLDLMLDAFPESQGKVEAASVVIHVQARNAPVNAQHNAATETPLAIEERDLVVMNDHAGGLHALGATLAGTLALADYHPAHSLFLDLIRPDAWMEAADALHPQPA